MELDDFGTRYVGMYRRAAIHTDFIALTILVLGGINERIRLKAVLTDGS
jgi:EAL domain-containing protein (putative c-di-GMP-specific phosphodiesterase class I)